jgi:hypothetical protein
VAAADVTPPADYQFMLQENALDLLYFHAAKRIYLERLACGGAGTGTGTGDGGVIPVVGQ